MERTESLSNSIKMIVNIVEWQSLPKADQIIMWVHD